MGSTTSSTQLKYSPRVSFVTQDKDNNEFIIRTLVTLAEIGLSFIPGVGQIGQAAIALVGTGIQAGLDASFQGKISP